MTSAWASLRTGLVALLLMMVGSAGFGLSMWLPIWMEPRPEPPPARAPFVPTPGKTIDAPELPYTFTLMRGFAPVLDANRNDARLVPEPWLPAGANIELLHAKLTEDASTLDEKQLAALGRVVAGGWTSGEALESTSAADGSPARMYPVGIDGSLFTVVFHGRTALVVHTTCDVDMSDAQRDSMREATRTLVRGVRFR